MEAEVAALLKEAGAADDRAVGDAEEALALKVGLGFGLGFWCRVFTVSAGI